MPRLQLNSLRARLSLGLGALALLFLTTVGVVLDRAFQASVERAAETRLELYLLALVGFAELDEARVRLPDAQLDQKFAQPGSGLYGLVRDAEGRVNWQSDSTIGRDIGALLRPAAAVGGMRPGHIRYETRDAGDLGPQLVGELSVDFQRPGLPDTRLSFVVALARVGFESEIAAFRGALWLGLGAVGLLLLLASFWLFRVVTRPLTQLSAQLAAVERGTSAALGGGWPSELAAVTEHLDRFIAQERTLRERYRTLTDDLAHSLKTPLAVLHNGLRESAPDLGLLQAQVARMQSVLANRLERVLVRPLLARSAVAAGPVLAELVSALARLHPQRRLSLEAQPDVRFPGEARDLMELAGNLADNACKYGDAQVLIVARSSTDPSGNGWFELIVDDDGAPIPAELWSSLLQRGVRADARRNGQGIGLAVVDALVAAYGGELALGVAELGGTRISVRLPLAIAPSTH